MTHQRYDQVEVHLFRRRSRRVEHLMLRRAKRARLLPHVWQPVTGRMRRGETAFAAARREVREETGLMPLRWWHLEAPVVYFDGAANAVVTMPVFVAEIDPRDRVALSSEHDAHAFVSAHEAARRYLWDAQRTALGEVQRQILSGGPLARALEITISPPTAQRAQPAANVRQAKSSSRRSR